ncbi:MAG: winged helix-turn-helix transcriptional regulator [Candidatus Muirbacterium halophilum]|nr:winged helix-turn-helix transcriptional regulator [Candidatus Muirbacterium halophilum]MCK9474810.1 winged helix-turn-helix transcriptional regulator [Candidatus Muirbacterium halophilum]
MKEKNIKPEFEFEDFFTIIIPRTENEPISEPISEPINDFLEELLSELVKNPYAKKEELSELMNVSRATVTRGLQKLKDMGILKRIGSNKTGYWEIKGKNAK